MGKSRPRKLFEDGLQVAADGFLIGGVLGSAYHFAIGGIQGVCNNVPRISRTSFSMAVFCAIYGAMVTARGKEEPTLDIAVAMGGTSGIIDLPKGLRCAGRSALIGGALGGGLWGGLTFLRDRKAGDPGLSARAR